MRNIPLRGQREEVIANLREVALLPFAAVDEGDVVLCKGLAALRALAIAER
jgi:hypothetical protein